MCIYIYHNLFHTPGTQYKMKVNYVLSFMVILLLLVLHFSKTSHYVCDINYMYLLPIFDVVLYFVVNKQKQVSGYSKLN